MKQDNEFTKGSKIEAFRLPRWLAYEARKTARLNDMTFSQLMRRALRRELDKEFVQEGDVAA